MGHHRRRNPDSKVRDAKHLAELIDADLSNGERGAGIATHLIKLHAIRFAPMPLSGRELALALAILLMPAVVTILSWLALHGWRFP